MKDSFEPLTVGSLSLALGNAVGDEVERREFRELPLGEGSLPTQV